MLSPKIFTQFFSEPHNSCSTRFDLHSKTQTNRVSFHSVSIGLLQPDRLAWQNLYRITKVIQTDKTSVLDKIYLIIFWFFQTCCQIQVLGKQEAPQTTVWKQENCRKILLKPIL